MIIMNKTAIQSARALLLAAASALSIHAGVIVTPYSGPLPVLDADYTFVSVNYDSLSNKQIDTPGISGCDAPCEISGLKVNYEPAPGSGMPGDPVHSEPVHPAIPEPGTIALIGGGLIAIGLLKRKIQA